MKPRHFVASISLLIIALAWQAIQEIKSPTPNPVVTTPSAHIGMRSWINGEVARAVWAYQGSEINIAVEILNPGTNDQTFNVGILVNYEPQAYFESIEVPGGESTTIKDIRLTLDDTSINDVLVVAHNPINDRSHAHRMMVERDIEREPVLETLNASLDAIVALGPLFISRTGGVKFLNILNGDTSDQPFYISCINESLTPCPYKGFVNVPPDRMAKIRISDEFEGVIVAVATPYSFPFTRTGQPRDGRFTPYVVSTTNVTEM